MFNLIYKIRFSFILINILENPKIESLLKLLIPNITKTHNQLNSNDINI